jgi:hypothetical protein
MPGPRPTQPVILAVSSSGGHWVQMCRLAPAFRGAQVHYATTDATAADMVDPARLHLFPDANKDTPLRLALCLVWLAWIVFRLRPRSWSRRARRAGSWRSGSPG